MTPLTAWADHVIPQARGCTLDMLALAVRNVCIVFCEQSKALTEDVIVPVVAGTHTYTLATPADTQVAQVMAVHLAGRTEPLEPQDPDWFDKWLPQWNTDAGETQYYYRPDAASIRLVLTPDADNTATIKVALRPTETATEVNDILFSQYRRHIATGALADLLSMSRKPWSDPARAQVLRSEFSSLISAAGANRSRGLTRRPLRSTATR